MPRQVATCRDRSDLFDIRDVLHYRGRCDQKFFPEWCIDAAVIEMTFCAIALDAARCAWMSRVCSSSAAASSIERVNSLSEAVATSRDRSVLVAASCRRMSSFMLSHDSAVPEDRRPLSPPRERLQCLTNPQPRIDVIRRRKLFCARRRMRPMIRVSGWGSGAVSNGIAHPGANFRFPMTNSITTRARAPLRLGLAGGGSDLPPTATSLAARFSTRRLIVSLMPLSVPATMGSWSFVPRIWADRKCWQRSRCCQKRRCSYIAGSTSAWCATTMTGDRSQRQSPRPSMRPPVRGWARPRRSRSPRRCVPGLAGGPAGSVRCRPSRL